MAHLKLFLYALLHYLTMKNIKDLNNTFSKFETKWKLISRKWFQLFVQNLKISVEIILLPKFLRKFLSMKLNFYKIKRSGGKTPVYILCDVSLNLAMGLVNFYSR